MGASMCGKMFSGDFKHNNESVDLFASVLKGDEPMMITEVLDLMFKWG